MSTVNLRQWGRVEGDLRALFHRFSSKLTGRRKRSRRRVVPVRLLVEALEDRTLPSVSIAGTIFHDFNANQTRESNEAGVPAIVAYLDLNHNGSFDGSQSSFQGSAGVQPGSLGGFGQGHAKLTVANLPPRLSSVAVNLDISKSSGGNVLVGLLSPRGFEAGSGANLVVLGAGESFDGTLEEGAATPVTLRDDFPGESSYRPDQLFTSSYAHIYDGDPNGIWGLVFIGDTTGLTLNSWSLNFTVAEPSAVADADGHYAFNDLAPGTYDVGIVRPNAAVQTTPTNNTVPVLVTASQTATVDFGVKPAADLLGDSFSVTGSNIDWGSQVTINYRLANRGLGNAGPFNVELRLSSDGAIGASDVLLTSFSVASLAGSSFTSGQLTVTLPGSPGSPPAGFGRIDQAFLGLRTDSQGTVTEESETNNSNVGSGADLAPVTLAPVAALTTDNAVQQNPSVAVDPNNPNRIVVVYMDRSAVATGYTGLRARFSSDGGQNWQLSTIALPADFNDGAAHPVANFDSQGRVFVSFMAAKFLGVKPPTVSPDGAIRARGFTANNGIFVVRSDDGGLTWGTPTAVTSKLYTGPLPFPAAPTPAQQAQKVSFDITPDSAVDRASGAIYVTFTRLHPDDQFPFNAAASGSEIMIAVSTDGGQSFQLKTKQVVVAGQTKNVSVIQDPDFGASPASTALAAEGAGFSTLPKVAVGPGGHLYLSMFAGGSFRVFHSADGANTFIAPTPDVLNAEHGTVFRNQTLAPATPAPTFLNAATSFRTNSVRAIVADPVRPGVVYAVEALRIFDPTTGATLDAGEIAFARSEDFGVTWQKSFSVQSNIPNIDELPYSMQNVYRPVLNDDNAGRVVKFTAQTPNEVISRQALPKIAIDEQGNLTVIWFDSRRDPGNTRIDVFGTVSTDGGRTFAPNFRISETTFDPFIGRFTDAQSGSITGATNATPIVITSSNHGLATGAQVLISGVLGNTNANGTRTITVINANTFSLNGISGNGAYTGGGTWNTANNPYFGDALGLAVVGGTAYVGWTGTTSTVGNQDVFFRRLALPPAGAPLGDRYEPNNTIATATNLGVVSSQRIIPRLSADTGDEDRFLVTAGAFGQLFIAADSAGAASLTLELLNSTGTQVLATGVDILDANGNVIGKQITRDNTAVNTVFMVRVTKSSGDADVPYSLRLRSLTGQFGTSVQGQQTGEIGNLTQIYSLTTAVAGSLEVKLSPTTNTRVEVVSADGLTVLATGTVVSGKLSISLSVDRGQNVLLRVSRTNGTQTGAYTLEFTNLDQFQSAKKDSLLFPASGVPSSVTAADVNGDGILDLVVASSMGADPVSVLLGNGDGTFEAFRQLDIGPGVNRSASAVREAVVTDLNGDQRPDIVVPNSRADNVSVLMGRGDGSFAPERRYDAGTNPDSVTVGDFNGDQIKDLVVLERFSLTSGKSSFALLLGRGDGSFLPPQHVPVSFTNGAFPIRTGDFNGDGLDDVAVFSFNDASVEIFQQSGDGTDGGTFTAGRLFPVGENSFEAKIADINGDGHLDIVSAGTNTGGIYLTRGNGDGTFQAPQRFLVNPPNSGSGDNVAIIGLEIIDYAGPTGTGAPDGIKDLIVTTRSKSGLTAPVLMLVLGQGTGGNFTGFGENLATTPALNRPQILATLKNAGKVKAADFNQDGTLDFAVTESGGVRIIYTKAPTIAANNSPASARDLGTVTHLISQPQAIVATFTDSYFKLTVPTETANGAGDQVLDFSALFEHTQGAGLAMEVLDANGVVLGSGPRLRVKAPQGSVLTVHVFGNTGPGGVRGVGVYTLDIDVLPQVVSVDPVWLVPGTGGPGGPVTSMVITFQGDRLDPALAENPANYTVRWLGPDGIGGTADDQVIPLAAGQTNSPVIYNPAAYLGASYGLTVPTALRQTATLLFDQALPEGAYEIELSPALASANLNALEPALLAPGFPGHGLVTAGLSGLSAGATVHVEVAASTAANFDAFTSGTPFLTQLHNDLAAELDALLATLGDDPSIATTLMAQILDVFLPGMPASTSFLIVWCDPVSIDLEDPAGNRVVYNLQTNQVSGGLSRTFVEVGRNVELLVLAGVSGTFSLNVSDVQASARGGAVLFENGQASSTDLTAAMRSGTREFQFEFSSDSTPPGSSTDGTSTASLSFVPGFGGPGAALTATAVQSLGTAVLTTLLVTQATGDFASIYGTFEDESALFARFEVMAQWVVSALEPFRPALEPLAELAARAGTVAGQLAETGEQLALGLAAALDPLRAQMPGLVALEDALSHASEGVFTALAPLADATVLSARQIETWARTVYTSLQARPANGNGNGHSNGTGAANGTTTGNAVSPTSPMTPPRQVAPPPPPEEDEAAWLLLPGAIAPTLAPADESGKLSALAVAALFASGTFYRGLDGAEKRSEAKAPQKASQRKWFWQRD